MQSRRNLMRRDEEDVGHQPNKEVRSFLPVVSRKDPVLLTVDTKLELFLPTDIDASCTGIDWPWHVFDLDHQLNQIGSTFRFW
jgi:hypothetical protein